MGIGVDLPVGVRGMEWDGISRDLHRFRRLVPMSTFVFYAASIESHLELHQQMFIQLLTFTHLCSYLNSGRHNSLPLKS